MARISLAGPLMLASGFAGLGYQIIWTQQSAAWLGHESAAVLAIVAAFFGGLSVGAFALGRRIERSARPGRWYAVCELVIGLWSLVLAFLMAPASAALLALTGAQPSVVWQWAVAFFGTFLLLLPATAAMGATLPAMERVTASLSPARSRIAMLYACNTMGAVLGVLAVAFWWVPAIGLARSAVLCAALNVACAFAAWRAFGAPVDVDAPLPAPPAASRGLVLLAATGLLGIGYEVLVLRVLSQVAENTVYTFAMLLAIYLIGSALGAAACQRWRSAAAAPRVLRDRLLCLLAAACLVGSLSLWGAEAIKAELVASQGGSMAAALMAEAALAAAAFLLPTFAMGALFSHLACDARAAGIGLGRALAANTVGAAAAPLVFGVALVPTIGPKFALLLVVAGYLALSSRPSAPVWAGTGIVAVLAWVLPPLAFVDVPEGGRVVSYREGAMAAVSVVEDAAGVSRLRIDNRQQEGSSASALADGRQALLPLLLHPEPRHALFLGLGTGVTARSATLDPRLQVDAVELLPEVIDASAQFNADAPEPRLRVIAADARRFMRASEARYDVIVSDNFHPARSGSGALYTVEHFRAVQDRLAEGGVFCQWLPLHQLDLATLRSIVRAFMLVYPHGLAMLATNSLETPTLGLVSRREGTRFSGGAGRARLAAGAAWQRSPAAYGLADEFALFGSFVAGPRALIQFAADAPVNTDDHPVVAYLAPRITYAPDSTPRDRLMDFLREMEVMPDDIIEPDAGPEAGALWPQRLAAYFAARNRFLDVGRDVQASPDVRQMLAQVREPLLSVLRISPDFRPAYDPLLGMASALAATDSAGARALLDQLVRIQPRRNEALERLRQLDPAADVRRGRTPEFTPSLAPGFTPALTPADTPRHRPDHTADQTPDHASDHTSDHAPE